MESVLLFTDGKANYGIRDKEPLTKATRYNYDHMDFNLLWHLGLC